jgi:hypothetical protein
MIAVDKQAGQARLAAGLVQPETWQGHNHSAPTSLRVSPSVHHSSWTPLHTCPFLLGLHCIPQSKQGMYAPPPHAHTCTHTHTLASCVTTQTTSDTTTSATLDTTLTPLGSPLSPHGTKSAPTHMGKDTFLFQFPPRTMLHHSASCFRHMLNSWFQQSVVNQCPFVDGAHKRQGSGQHQPAQHQHPPTQRVNIVINV